MWVDWNWLNVKSIDFIVNKDVEWLVSIITDVVDRDMKEEVDIVEYIEVDRDIGWLGDIEMDWFVGKGWDLIKDNVMVFLVHCKNWIYFVSKGYYGLSWIFDWMFSFSFLNEGSKGFFSPYFCYK